MEEIKNDVKLIAYCGLYCGSCGSFVKGKCPGCANNEKASWCAIRTCNLENSYQSCADCKTFDDPMKCGKYNNFISKVIGFILRSNRAGCISLIKEKGYENFAAYMAENKLQTIRK